MAKKVVATLAKGDAVKLTKLIQVKKSAKTGAYTFRSRIVASEVIKEIVASKG
ncbi:MAG: DUF4295 domain-containing protein [Candidatus Cardinium sp.]|uniref:DUF4295 domain-containing protein n=1 Tax=Candidatus Cardinium sp. TP TaxID=2961955 RepID=UPI0021AFC9B5|nr:DUF4295 domain-containing protein [Candidatus Cardinium sp. TP]MCT4697414.1 DUF4295 domain-containing protein [Candidatus Cardinium sp. TP]MDN5247076.1 DUF4295 domain-containing protein [Candidatus Cardinium sp.]